MAGVFKSYDVRGVYPDEISDDLFYKIGKAFVIVSKAKKLIVGHDMRFSSPHLHKAMIKGIVDQGCDVMDIGLASTPMVYFAAGFFNCGSVQITASHNDGEYNGCKFTKDGTIPVGYDTGLKDVEKLVDKNNMPPPDKFGKVEKKDVRKEYFKHVEKFAGEINKDLKIVIDFGNGMDAYTVPSIFKDLGIEFTSMYKHLVGSFPHHIANPLKPENVKDLQAKVKELKADVGFAFDGDGDRIGVIDEKCNLIHNDLITAFFIKHLLEKNKKSVVCYDLRSSIVVKEIIDFNKAKGIMTPVGHVHIKKLMRENNADFAGEVSGHYYWKDNYFCDSGVIACVKFLTLISKEKRKLSAIMKEYKKYVSSGEINSEVKDEDKIINSLKNDYYKDAKETYDFDGILKRYDDWWFLVRPSNTEPLLRLIVEAKDKKLMKQKSDELLAIIRA